MSISNLRFILLFCQHATCNLTGLWTSCSDSKWCLVVDNDLFLWVAKGATTDFNDVLWASGWCLNFLRVIRKVAGIRCLSINLQVRLLFNDLALVRIELFRCWDGNGRLSIYIPTFKHHWGIKVVSQRYICCVCWPIAVSLLGSCTLFTLYIACAACWRYEHGFRIEVILFYITVSISKHTYITQLIIFKHQLLN